MIREETDIMIITETKSLKTPSYFQKKKQDIHSKQFFSEQKSIDVHIYTSYY